MKAYIAYKEWHLEPRRGEEVVLFFRSFDVECGGDYVEVSNTTFNKKFCDKNITEGLGKEDSFRSSSAMKIKMHTDDSHTRSGFSASFFYGTPSGYHLQLLYFWL